MKISNFKFQISNLIFILFFLLITHHSSLVTALHAQPVLSPGPPPSWDGQDVEPGSVIKDGSIYKIWYTGFDGKRYRIGYAFSKDGFKWERHDEPVLKEGEKNNWDGFSVAYPSVVKDGDIYKMWLTGSNG